MTTDRNGVRDARVTLSADAEWLALAMVLGPLRLRPVPGHSRDGVAPTTWKLTTDRLVILV